MGGRALVACILTGFLSPHFPIFALPLPHPLVRLPFFACSPLPRRLSSLLSALLFHHAPFDSRQPRASWTLRKCLCSCSENDPTHPAALQVGDYLAKRINEFEPSAEKPHFVLGLPTGSSPLPTYHRLVELVQKGDLSFKVSCSRFAPLPTRLTDSPRWLTERGHL